MKPKKVPMRQCLGCMEMKPKKDLIRVVKNKEGEVSLDMVGKKPGRGAYIDRTITCLEKAFKTKRLNKNLETNISEEIYQSMREIIENE